MEFLIQVKNLWLFSNKMIGTLNLPAADSETSQGNQKTKRPRENGNSPGLLKGINHERSFR
jgi:hypothetical protein